MKSLKLILGTFMLTLLLLMGQAQATNIPQYGPIPFNAFDMDTNGVITEQEFLSVRQQRHAIRAAQGRLLRNAANAPLFSEFDLNADGQLNRDELISGQKAQQLKRGCIQAAPPWCRRW